MENTEKTKENTFYVDTDKSKLDLDGVYDFLNNRSYWAKGRSRETVERSVENSLCFGVFTAEGRQAGFARVVSDYAVFAWIMDLFILEEYRGNGLGKLLMREITGHKELQGVKKWGLGTKDAHGLYKEFGFTPLAKPEMMMERVL